MHKTKKWGLSTPGSAGTLSLMKNKLMVSYSNLASEASPTLGCSIEISRDIYMLSVCRMSYVCRMSN